MTGGFDDRRPLQSRDTRWARWLAAKLVARRVGANTISAWSIVFAAAAGGCLLGAYSGGRVPAVALLLIAAVCIQLRLLCNLLDGMVALESNTKSPTGELWNELPDRLADLLILVPAGYAIAERTWGPALGWGCGALAVLTAYVRALGTSLGVRRLFLGPMAKPHRMAVMTVASLLAALEVALDAPARVLSVALIVVAAGSSITIVRRVRHIAQALVTR